MKLSMKKTQLSKLLMATVLATISAPSCVWATEYATLNITDGATHTYNEDVTLNGPGEPYIGLLTVENADTKLFINGNVYINVPEQNRYLGIGVSYGAKLELNGSEVVISNAPIGIMNLGSMDINSKNTTINIQNLDSSFAKGILSSSNSYINVQNLKLNITGNMQDTVGLSRNVNVNGNLDMLIDVSRKGFTSYANDRLVVFSGNGYSSEQINLKGSVNNINVIASDLASVMLSAEIPVSIAANTTTNVNLKYTESNNVASTLRGFSEKLTVGENAKLNINMDLPTSESTKKTYMTSELGANSAISLSTRQRYAVTEFTFAKGSSVNINVSGAPIADMANGLGSVIGINGYTKLTADGSVNINVSSTKGVGIRLDDTALSNDYFGGNMQFNGDTIVKTNAGYAALSTSISKMSYSSRSIDQEPYGVFAYTGMSNLYINPNGGSLVQLTGNLDHKSKSMSLFNIKMDTKQSFLNGSIMNSSNSGITILMLDNGATWNMTGKDALNLTGNSAVAIFGFSGNGYLNMTPSGNFGYESLTVLDMMGGNYGKILMNTDLQASFDSKDVMANSDRIIVNNLSGGVYTIDVKDASLFNKSKVPAEGYLLLVKGNRMTAAIEFVGGQLQKGGIFKYKPIITAVNPDPTKYQNTPNTINWYLTGFEKQGINEEPIVSMGLAESRYIAYMNEQDTLVKRLGELRQHDKEHGIWARVRGANNSVAGYAIKRNSYVSTHLGYDWKLKEQDNSKAKRYMGVAFNHTNNKFDYNLGATGTGQSNVLTLYGTRLGDKGHYLDLVGKIGRMSNEYKYQEQNVSAQNWFYSLSAEYGRSIVRNSGWYYEPQVQFTFGHINGTKYSNQETTVNAGSINSAILRAGLLFGRKINQDVKAKELSYYGKVFWSHEFGGNVKTSMNDIYGDRLDLGHNYSGSWVTVGVGTAMNINKSTNLYLDVEKAFGGKINGGWAWQAGMRWRF